MDREKKASQSQSDQERLEQIAEKSGETNQAILQNVVAVSESFSGPLPPPITFEKYEEIYPGACEIIFGMAQKEQRFQQNTLKEDQDFRAFTQTA